MSASTFGLLLCNPNDKRPSPNTAASKPPSPHLSPSTFSMNLRHVKLTLLTPLLASTAKKRTSEAITSAPPAQNGEKGVEKSTEEEGSAVKKLKLEEVATTEPHKTKEMPAEAEGDAMDMDMEDDEEEQYVAMNEFTGMTPEEIAAEEENRKMMEEMGIPSSFGTTKGRHVQGNNLYVANKVKQRKSRQLIHKKGPPKTGRPPGPK